MNVNRSSLSREALVLCVATLVGLLGLGVGCSADDIVADATADAVEAELNSVLASTVDPLISFLGAVPAIVNGGAALRPSLGGVICPNTDLVCSGGSVVCASDGFSLTFTFDDCVVVTGDGGFTLDGELVATPGVPIALQLNSLFINNSPAMTGTGSVNVGGCSYAINVFTIDASVDGTIIKCDSDAYPTAASDLAVSFDDALIDITFDGSAIASAVAYNGDTVVANCGINLAANPLSSNCSAP